MCTNILLDFFLNTIGDHPSEFVESNCFDDNSTSPANPIPNECILVQNKTSDSGEPFPLNEEIPTEETENTDPNIEINADLLPERSKFAGPVPPKIVVRENTVVDVLNTILVWPEKQTNTKQKEPKLSSILLR